MGSILSAIIGALSSFFSTVVEYPLRSVAVVTVLAIIGGAFIAGKRYGEKGNETVPLRRADEPILEEDLPDPTLPDWITTYPEPDSTVVETTWVRVPDFVSNLRSRPAPDTVTRWRTRPSIQPLTSPTLPDMETDLAGLPDAGFYLLPIIEGAPAVTVVPGETRLQAYHPRTAEGVRFRWDHPEPFLQFGALVESGVDWTAELHPRGQVGLWAGHSVWRLEAGYRFDSREAMSGFTVSARWAPKLYSTGR